MDMYLLLTVDRWPPVDRGLSTIIRSLKLASWATVMIADNQLIS